MGNVISYIKYLLSLRKITLSMGQNVKTPLGCYWDFEDMARKASFSV
jgi:hypothetical protein